MARTDAAVVADARARRVDAAERQHRAAGQAGPGQRAA